MIILIAGGTHTGKTKLAKKLVAEYGYFCLSIDHIKMGLIRSGYTSLTPESDDDELTEYLWPVIREIIKTNIENSQDIIIEGCYIPFDWKKDFSIEYLPYIKYKCLIFTERYINEHYDDIIGHENDAEARLEGNSCEKESLIEENIKNLDMCRKYGLEYVLSDDEYIPASRKNLF